jgi:hypothetical protein
LKTSRARDIPAPVGNRLIDKQPQTFVHRDDGSCCLAQRLGAPDPLALARAVHGLPQVGPPLHVQPEVRRVAAPCDYCP